MSGCVAPLAFDGAAEEEPYGPETTLAAFETAYNEGDIEAMFDCFDPVTAKGVKAALNLLGDFAGFDMQSLMDLTPFLYDIYDSQDFSGTDMQDAKPVISIRVIDSNVSGNSANVRAAVSIAVNGQTNEQEATFPMVLEDGVWYIKGTGLR